MKTFNVNITKRTMKRKHRDGRTTTLDRYVLNYRDPGSSQRRSEFCDTRKAAEARREELYRLAGQNMLGGRVSKADLTVEEAVQHWLKSCETRVEKTSLESYSRVARDYIIGPLLNASPDERRKILRVSKTGADKEWLAMLGKQKVSDLTTAHIRQWQQSILTVSTPYVARTARKHLKAILSMAAEDFGLRVPPMPRRAEGTHRKRERVLLRQDQVKAALEEAIRDRKYGVYYAFLFLTGVRPGEMLGLLWEDVDFVANIIHIRRNQDKDGNIKNFPKTAAGQRPVPIVPQLREMLLSWRDRCPHRKGQPVRVFPSVSGGPLLIANFRNRVWNKMLKRLQLPSVTPYVTRHLVISNLQAQGVEVGLVARIAGHANPQITLQHYTHQVRDSAGIMEKLNDAYGLH